MNEISNGFSAMPEDGFSAVSRQEQEQVEGGSFLSGAYHWVRDHIGLGGKDMSGNSAGVVSVKGKF
jgi:hypothetical protein